MKKDDLVSLQEALSALSHQIENHQQNKAVNLRVKSLVNELNNKFTQTQSDQMQEALSLLIAAICDEKGLGRLNLMLYNARIPPKYYDIFYQMLAENMGGGGGSPSENVGSLSQRGSPSQNAEFFQNNNAFETCSTSQAKQQLSENEPFKNGELASLEPSYNNEVSKARSSLQIQEDKAPIVIDCGAHAGLVSDLCLHCGATVYAFEPNIYLQYFLKRKFEGKKARLYQKAVGVKNYKTSFKVFQGRILSQGNRVVSSVQDKETSQSYEVEVIDLCEFIEKEFITQKKQIYLLKLDIEGAEFEILEKLITKKLYKHIKFIACETHEYMFKDGKARLEKLKAQISKAKITNILLDWC